MYAFYLPRGHSIEELDKLDSYETFFYQLAMGKYYEDLFELINTVVIMYLGDDKAKKKILNNEERK